MNKTLLFTHIPKTAGTSFKESVIYPNVNQIKYFSGFKELIMSRGQYYDFLEGHYPYGVHYFIKEDVEYITILRDALEQAISYYYFVKQCDTESYKHPNLSDAKKYDLQDFYTLPRYMNMQTKYIAGFPFNKMAGIIGNKKLLDTAKKNLVYKYKSFGLLKYIDIYQFYISSQYGWQNLEIKNQSKKTIIRPAVHDLTDDEKNIIKENNFLDVALFEFAEREFCRRFKIAYQVD